MNTSALLLDRLTRANPGWAEWNDLIALVETLSFEQIEDEHLGTYFVSDRPLVFAEPSRQPIWPAWLPPYVSALYGLNADDMGTAGGFADAFSEERVIAGAVFSQAGNDEDLGFPPIDIPPGVYYFQMDPGGAVFFISDSLDVLYPNSTSKSFAKLDTLESFARKNIQRALDGESWIAAYPDIEGDRVD